MNEFLSRTYNDLKTKKYNNLTLVIGNESCDLDSAVSALVYASYLDWQHNQIKCKRCTKDYRDNATYQDDIFVPILNVNKEEFALKTEIVYCFGMFGVNRTELVFRDEYNIEELVIQQKTEVILVDHHCLAKKDEFLAPFVIEVIDHRPFDKTAWRYKDDTRSTIEIVGSACTLVCERIMSLSTLLSKDAQFFRDYPSCSDLLHSTIILDTVNFSKEVNKATKKDEEIIKFLEELIKPDNIEEYRQNKLHQLEVARSDVSSLTAAQLLRKDVKIVGEVYVPSFPIFVETVLKKENIKEALQMALERNNCNIALLLGMNLQGKSVERDLAIFSTDEDKVNQMVKTLETWTQTQFNLSPPTAVENVTNCVYFKQLNKAASRKQYIPAINSFLDTIAAKTTT